MEFVKTYSTRYAVSMSKIFERFSLRLFFLSSFLLCYACCIVFFLYQCLQVIPLVTIFPKLLGYNGTQTYLILFQNNAELRPGGGFIGSYGLVSFDHGKMGQFTIHNVYDADGLLTKHIEPSYIGRRYLQVHLY